LLRNNTYGMLSSTKMFTTQEIGLFTKPSLLNWQRLARSQPKKGELEQILVVYFQCYELWLFCKYIVVLSERVDNSVLGQGPWCKE
jgi:hypothetical protein